MLLKILICLVIILVPMIIWTFFTAWIQGNYEKDEQKYRKLLESLSNPQTFEAKVISKELINYWTVLTATPSPDGSGFYIKTADRNVDVGYTICMAVLPDFENRETELRGTQVILDESGRFMTAADYDRMMSKFESKRMDAQVGILMFQRLTAIGYAVILGVTLIISAVILLHHSATGA